MMIAFVTLVEGGRWYQLDSEDIQFFLDREMYFFAAVRVGDWIYDFVLKNQGYNPWRYNWRND